MPRRCIVCRPVSVLAWRLMLLLGLIGMALSSLGGAIAASQDPPPITQEEAQADEPAVETAEPAGTQPPDTGEATEPVVAGTEEPEGEQVAAPPLEREPAEAPFFLQLIKRVCPAKEGFAPASAAYAELDDACRLEVADPASFFFIVTDAAGGQHVENRTDAFLELPTGRTRAAEKHGGGYGDPVVWCSFGKGEPPDRMEVVNREVALDPKPETLVTCEFFNPELPPPPEASLTIHKRACAEGYDLGSEKADPIVDCTEPAAKVPFALADADPTTPDQQQDTGAVIESGVVFEGLAGGGYTVTETPPEGVTGAVVWACEVDGRSVDSDGPPLSEGFRLDLEIPAGTEVVCFWFNLRGGAPGAGDDGSITVLKVACPAGYDVTSEKSDPLVDCTKPMDDVGFVLRPADPDVDPQKGVTGDAGRGMVTFEGLPAGTYALEERLPEGIAEAAVWACSDDPRQQRALDGPLATGTRLEVELAAGQDLWCLWLNVLEERPAEPTDDGTDLTLYKWECPAGADSSAQDAGWYAEQCTAPMAGVVFEVATDGDTLSRTTDAAGRIVWPDLPMGTISVREGIPAGYGDPVVYCRVDETSPMTAQPVKEGTIQAELGVTALTCHWYNIPGLAEPTPETTPTPVPTETASEPSGENSLTIYKWECPPGTASDQDPDWYASSCEIEMMGIPFAVTSANGTTAAQSQPNGTVFDHLPDGTLTVREDIPFGYGPPRVFCASVDAPTSTELPVTDGAVLIELGAGAEDIICRWYNIPEPTEGPTPTASSGIVVGQGEPCGTATDASVITIDPDDPCGTATVIAIDPDGAATVSTAAPSSTPVGTPIPSGAEPEGNTVTVRKWACPPGTAYGKNQAWYIENCVPMDGVEFRLITSAGSQVASTEGGVVAWSGLPMGNVGLRETIPDGYGDPVMYCQSNVFGTTIYNPLGAGIVSWGVPGDRAYSFDCDWYNVPLPGELAVGDTAAPAGSTTPESTRPMPWTPTSGVATIAPTERAGEAATETPGAPEAAAEGAITVVKVTCPAGVGIEDLDPIRVGDCTKLTDDIAFTLTGADGEVSQRGRTGADGRGTLTFAGLPAGSYEVTEAAQDGTEPVVWACGATIRELVGADGPLATSGSVTVELSASEDLTCLWLNVEEAGSPGGDAGAGPGTMSLHLTARECGPTPPDSPTIAGYRAMCPDRAQVQFTVVLTLPDEIRNIQGQQVDEQGTVTLVDLPVSEPRILLFRAGGYTMPSVFCRTGGAWSAASVDVSGTSWMHQLPLQESGAQIVCEWYIPVDPVPQPGVFEVRHFFCDADVVAPSEDTCAADNQGFFYRVRVEGEPEPTGTHGILALPYHLTVPRDVAFVIIDTTAPAVARPPAVFCGPWVDTGAAPESHPNHGWLEASGETRVAFSPIGVDESLRCDWYTFPAPGG